MKKEKPLPVRTRIFIIKTSSGLTNVHLNIEALKRHTQHVQFVTFHREDANKVGSIHQISIQTPNPKCRLFLLYLAPGV